MKWLGFKISGFVILLPQLAVAELDYNALGNRAFALWDCASYGGLTEVYRDDAVSIFAEGHDLFTTFVGAWYEGKLNDENTSELPIGIRLRLTQGTSVEFSLGYMWAQFQEHAYEETWDLDLDATFDQKSELQASKASNEFRKKNCKLLAE